MSFHHVLPFIQQHLSEKRACMLLLVCESQGSSPGRQGFSLAVASDDSFTGTIGGGIMEQKWVEAAKNELKKNDATEIRIVAQYHDKAHASHQSGMICSGLQRLALVRFNPTDLSALAEANLALAKGEFLALSLQPNGWTFGRQQELLWEYEHVQKWKLNLPIGRIPVIHIIGGGHVSLALSELMHYLGFQVHVYDDRPNLPTMEENRFAHSRNLVDYEKLESHINLHEEDFVAIMTIGYRTDKLALTRLLGLNVKYMGMLGSEKKIETLKNELIEEGYDLKQLDTIFWPIGLGIYSQTAREIAVSIAAEIIREKNKHLPTGRTKIER